MKRQLVFFLNMKDEKVRFLVDMKNGKIELGEKEFKFCWCRLSLNCEHNKDLELGIYNDIIQDICLRGEEHSRSVAERCFKSWCK